MVQENYRSAPLAYNAALDQAPTDLLLFAHQDVYFPDGWFARLAETLERLDRAGIRWGVLGCHGSDRRIRGGLGTVYTTGLGFHGNAIDEPRACETLDEIVLVVRKSSGLRFDPCLPGFHLYGTELCLQAQHHGLGVYAVPGVCVHNTNQLMVLPDAFYDAYRYVKRKWLCRLPIYTPCITISHLDEDMRWRRLRHRLDRALGLSQQPLRRIPDPRVVLATPL
jgi:hypothetical protein